MPTREILMSHPVATLKKEISRTNIKGYSKMKKSEIVQLMLDNKDRFGHIKMAPTRKEKKEIEKKQEELRQARKRSVKERLVTIIPKKSKPKKEKKDKKTLTATKADGTVVELKIRDRKKKK